jgi:hypothetical protein
MFGYESVLDVPPANAVRPQQHQSLPLEGRIGHCQKRKIAITSLFHLPHHNLLGNFTTSSYVTKSNWSKTALCFAKYLSLYCFFLRPNIEQLTANRTD